MKKSVFFAIVIFIVFQFITDSILISAENNAKIQGGVIAAENINVSSLVVLKYLLCISAFLGRELVRFIDAKGKIGANNSL